jgi:hypothetical protein
MWSLQFWLGRLTNDISLIVAGNYVAESLGKRSILFCSVIHNTERVLLESSFLLEIMYDGGLIMNNIARLGISAYLNVAY